MDKGQIGLGGIMTLFIIMIVALALIPAIFNTQTELTNKVTVSNESIDITSLRNATGRIINIIVNTTVASGNIPTGWRTTECPITSFVLRNQTGNTLTENTDYVFTGSNGKLALKNTGAVNTSGINTTYADYTYCMEGYNKDGSSRSIAGLIGLFSVIALIGAVIVYIKFEL